MENQSEMKQINESIWTVDDLLTREECDKLKNTAEKEGMDDIGSASTFSRSVYRDCLRAELDDKSLADAVWKRLRDKVPQKVWVGNDHAEIPGVKNDEEMHGCWEPCGINHHWRVCCYPGRGHFSPHRDGDYIVNKNERSLLTINGYLTALPPNCGGATRFMTDEQTASFKDEEGRFAPMPGSITHRVEANKAGKAVIFFHGLMHDGEPLVDNSPPKWLFRTEVIYRRVQGTELKLSVEQMKARELMEKAKDLEVAGIFAEAARCYNQAFKLDETLEQSI
uniref:Fe2OG dioxygenase domain-containing protein n=1 Tax=Ditylum brightwellii TaxID=49249 RepID=A0A7S4W0D2_9STRA|mmetsp:Transcript_11824/g.15753  ORF Transcript_11824/g.15753 Transcript_11824/m.15753 type:complete len:280 (-) Transcript_11824:546-1385(-)